MSVVPDRSRDEKLDADDFKNLLVYRVDLGMLSGIYANILPIKCLDYEKITRVDLDVLFTGQYDIGIVPPSRLLAEISEYRRDIENLIQVRNQQMISSAVSFGKPLINAKLTCDTCPIRFEREKFLESNLSARMNVLNLKLF